MHTRQTKNWTYSAEFAARVVAAYLVDPGAALLAAPKVRLFQGEAFNPTANTPLADFTAAVATFTDYVEKTPTLASPVSIATSGKAAGAVVDWLMVTDPTVTQNSVRGYYVADGAVLVGFETWPADEAVGMTAPGDRLILELLLPFLYFQPAE